MQLDLLCFCGILWYCWGNLLRHIALLTKTVLTNENFKLQRKHIMGKKIILLIIVLSIIVTLTCFMPFPTRINMTIAGIRWVNNDGIH